jgi:hypothetical protein
MAIKVGKIVNAASQALDITADAFLHRIEVFATPRNGQSEFSKTMTKDYRSDSSIRCTWQFASAVLDFLYVHKKEIRDARSLASVERDCMEVLRQPTHRVRRYSYFATDVLPASERAESLTGLYAVVRQDTGDGRMRQELLVLNRSGSADTKGRLLGTFVTPEIVTRGVWTTSQDTLSFTGAGRRKDFSVSIVTFGFALPDDSVDVLGGVLCGTSSIEGLPVLLPLLAFKIPGAYPPDALVEFCDQPDAKLRGALEASGRYKKDPPELRSILDNFELHKSRILGARDLVLPFRGLGKPAASYILPGIRKLAQANVARK